MKAVGKYIVITPKKDKTTTTKGGLILGHYGKGTVVYTGISFFRQIPDGVSGAYKLLANLLSYRHD